MSICAIAWAFQQNAPSPISKFVLVKLADSANDDGKCWPAIQTIANHTGLSRTTVKAHIAKLVKVGLIKVEHRQFDDVHLSNVYYLPIPGGVGREPTDGIAGGIRREVPDDGPREDRRVGREPTTNRQRVSEPSTEPSKDSSPTPINRKNGKGTYPKWVLDAFAIFYGGWPEKIDRREALHAFAKVIERGEATVDEICAGRDRYIEHVGSRRADGFPDLRFCGPAVFLNKRRWEDSYTNTPGVVDDVAEEPFAGAL